MSNRISFKRPKGYSNGKKDMLVNSLLITHAKTATDRLYKVKVNPITLKIASSYLRPIITLNNVTFYYMKDKDSYRYVIFIPNKDCIKVARMFDGFSMRYHNNVIGFRCHKNLMSFIKYVIKNYECDSIHMKYLHKPIRKSLERLFNNEIEDINNIIELM